MVLTIIGLVVVQAFVSSNVSTVGVDFSRLQGEIKAYHKENVLLKEKLLLVSSYTQIAEEAEDKGFVPLTDPLALSPSSTTLAQR